MKIKSFRDLKIWQLGMEIIEDTYKFTEELPQQEQYNLVLHMHKSAVSLPSNVAEGFRRRNNKEYRQFLHIALGSAAELETQIEICRRIYKTDEQATMNLLDKSDHFQAMGMSLIKELNA